MKPKPAATIAIGTGQAIETSAVCAVLDDVEQYGEPGDPGYYYIGTTPSLEPGRPHVVVVAQRDPGGPYADLARTFPQVNVVIVCGTAAGVVMPDKGPDGVHLGDIVVAGDGSASLRRVDDKLHVAGWNGQPLWLPIVEELSTSGTFRRPLAHTDRLNVGPLRRTDERPRVHRGIIAQVDGPQVKAVETTPSGAIPPGWSSLRVLGVADYVDSGAPSDDWIPYAALVAAAYVRALLSECRPLAGGLRGLAAVVGELLTEPLFVEEPGRRTLIRQLPGHVAAAVTHSDTPRIHVLNLLHACKQYPDGAQMLITAIEEVLGSDSPSLGRIEPVIRQHWPQI